MSRQLDDLSSRFRPLVVEFLARLVEVQIPVLIVDTLRTQKEQEENLRKGVSWTPNSKHLPQPPEDKAEAIDICPFEVFRLYGEDKLNWNSSDPIWERIGTIGESVGLHWGGRWGVRDCGHFQYKEE